jgi:signal transduction histidine kinase
MKFDSNYVVARARELVRRVDELAAEPSRKRILAVDDSPMHLDFLADALEAEGYEVALASSGEQALERLGKEVVDCLLLDLIMPGLGGEETCRRVKFAPETRAVPVIVLTALEDREATARGFGAGADDCVVKSPDLAVLKSRIVAQIARRQLEDEHIRIREQLLRAEMEAAGARAARELAEMRATLLEDVERKNKELEAFSYSVSHDLRAPLRSIGGFSQLLLDRHAKNLNAQAQDYLGRIRAAAQRMDELIDDLLQLARVGRAEMRRVQTDLSAMARSIAADLERCAVNRVVHFEIESDIVAVCDARLMRIVLENLLGNAWKFTAKSDRAIIEFGSRSGGGQVVFFVRDNGVGFDMTYADKLFGPFQRLHTQNEFPGTGIGLATVHRIIERHGGRIWAEGALDRGATISWTLPVPPLPPSPWARR